MKKQLSMDYFLGKNGLKRLNCAQAHSIVFGADEKLVSKLKHYGVGKAPDGECGIYYAGKEILMQQSNVHKVDDYTGYFNEIAGTLYCNELRKKKVPFCAECLGLSVEYVEKAIKPD